MIIKLFNLKLVITLYNDGLKFFDKTSSVDGIVKILPKCFSKKTGMKFNVKNIKHFSLFYSKTNQPKFKVQEMVDEIKKTYPTIKIVDKELPAIIAAHTGSDYVVVVCEFK
jgi:fatty acid-binding protein DegV